MNSLTKFLMVISAIGAIAIEPTLAKEWKHSYKSNSCTFSTSHLSIVQGKFYAVINWKNELVRINPEGDPTISKETVHTPLGNGERKNYTWNLPDGYTLTWHITQIEDDIFSLQGSFTNEGIEPVYLEKFVLLDGVVQIAGKADEWMLSTTDVEARRIGTLAQSIPSESDLSGQGAYARNYFTRRGLSDKAKDPMSRCYLNDASLYKLYTPNGMVVAAVDTIADVYIETKIEQNRLDMEVQSDMSEIRIDPKESRKSDEVLFIAKPWGEAQSIRNKWIAAMTGTMITKKPAYGWCSWYRAGLNVTPEDINRIVDFVNENKNRIPFEVVQIDDGWQVFRGNWNENSKFEEKLKPLADKIRENCMMPGIWLSPVRCDKIIGVCKELERPFPSSWYTNYNIGKPSSDRFDPTHPKVKEFMTASLKQCREKGYTYYKLDFSQIPFGAKRFHNSKMTRFQAQRELFRILREAIGPDSYLLACGISDQRSMLPYIDADRIGTDCSPGRGFAKELASDRLPKDIHGFLFPILSMVNKCHENGVLCHGDPDVTYTGLTGKTSPKQLQTYHSFIGTYAGLALTSDLMYKFEANRDDHIRMMEILYPVTKEKGVAFTGGWDLYGKEFGYTVEREWGNAVNVITWNPSHTEKQALGIKYVPTENIGKRFHIWSFWDEEYKGIGNKNYHSTPVGPYEHELLRLTPVSDKPTVVGSNLHIGMGTAEIKNISFKEGHMTICMDPNAGARNGRIYIYSRKPLNGAKSTNSQIQLLKKAENLYVLVLAERKRNVEETITLSVGNESPANWKEIAASQTELVESTSFTREWKQSW